MYYTKAIAALSLLLPLSIGLPTAEDENSTLSSTESHLMRRDNGAWCGFYYDRYNVDRAYTVTTWGSWANDWGANLLSNLGTQCQKEIEDWGFSYDNNGIGTATFSIGLEIELPPANCVENSIWLASGPDNISGVTCQQDGVSCDPEFGCW
jgi:hypothetical protein